MTQSLPDIIEALGDDDREALHAALDGLPEVNVGRFSTYAFSIMQARPLMSLRMLSWLMEQNEPTDPTERGEWLKANNNACYLANFHGEPEERRSIVDRALLRAAPDNIAIYHNAAGVLCLLGDATGALDAISQGIARGFDEATIDAIRNDSDLDLIRSTPAFLDIVRSHAELVLPAWADGWTSAQYTQFREAIRTSLADCDLADFDEGRVRSAGETYDILDLARRCKGLDAAACTMAVHRQLHAMLSR